MRKGKKLLAAALAMIVIAGSFGAVPAQAAAWGRVPTKVTIVNAQHRSISKKTVYEGNRFELDADVNRGAEDDYLEWKIISGKGVVKFVDYEKYGDEAELKAVKAGKAKVQVYVNGKTGKKVQDTITITVKKASSGGGKIMAKGSTTKYEEVYDDFDLEVLKSKSSIKESKIKWKIQKPDIVRFLNGKHTGHEVDFYAKKTGKTKIYCTYNNGKKTYKITFTVRVVWDD